MVSYRVRLADLRQHHFEVDCRIDAATKEEYFSLPSWIPGSYLLREYARHVVSARAESQRREVAITKVDKSTWKVQGAQGELTVTIRVHALDLSVRGAYLDTQRGYFNGTCLFLSVRGRADESIEVELESPADPLAASWRVATAMLPAQVDARGFGRYVAADYAELIDHPVEVGHFARIDFTVAGIPHALVIAGKHETDHERIATDLRQLCEAQQAFFGAPAPFDRYLFLGLAVDKGYGGLEHRASSSLIFSANDLPRPVEPGAPAEYQRFLSLCSHEYFHAWHIKQLKPAAFSPPRLNERNYTRLLWVFEGITTYYQDRLLLCSDLIGRDAYLSRLAQTLTKVYRTPGRFQQSVAESSFEAWDKLYKPEPNSANATISYYSKGALVALALDLTLRAATDSAVSLDRLIVELWNRYGRQGTGLGETDFEEFAERIAGFELKEFFDTAIRDTVDLPLGDLLDKFGVTFELRPATGPQDQGGAINQRSGESLVSLGVTQKEGPQGLELVNVQAGGPAEAAGMSAGDQIIALGGYRIDAQNLARRLERFDPGDSVTVAFFRRNELFEAELTVASAPLDTCSLTVQDEADPAKRRLRTHWLGN